MALDRFWVPGYYGVMDDTLTLALDGQVTLDDFARAISRFHGIVAALSREIPGGEAIIWEVSNLQAGSAIADVTGRGPNSEVELVVREYERLGEELERRGPLNFSPAVQAEARGLVGLINGRIESIRMETARQEHLIGGGELSGVEVSEVPEFPRSSLGAIQGVIETLSRRGGLKFTLYDLMHKKSISCYLPPGSEDRMRDAWGKNAIVHGIVRKDPATGRPLSIRDVTKVETVSESGPGDWRLAGGAVARRADDDPSPEEAIRLIRDA